MAPFPARHAAAIGAIYLACLSVAAAPILTYVRAGGTSRDGAAANAQSIGGTFRLVGGNGQIVDSGDFKGRPFAVVFGYTHCPGVCQTTLTELSRLLVEFGAAAKDFRVFLITLDPARDTPGSLREYLSSFDPRITGLSGAEADISNVAKLYHVFYRKIPTESGDYMMEHTAAVYLMRNERELFGVFSFDEPHETIVRKLRRLLDESATNAAKISLK